jgi:hypothetical protein
MTRTSFRHVLAGGMLLALAHSANAIPIRIDALSTFYLTSAESPPAALALDLSSIGATPGDTLVFSPFGDFARYVGAPENDSTLAGLFSSSTVLLAATELHRVPGAIDAGDDFSMDPTFFGGIPTDITEDFLLLPGLSVVIPQDALYLFISVPDIFYGDNGDSNGDLRVDITVRKSVPEPGTLALLGASLLVMRLARRRRLGLQA